MSALPAADRRRALSLMGVDVYVLRARDAGAPRGSEGHAAAAGAAWAGSVADARNAAPRVVFALPDGGGLEGPHANLLRHLALALGVDPREVAFGAPRADLPCVCFGVAPGDGVDVVLAPPPNTLRASARARRALWPDLRALARRMGR